MNKTGNNSPSFV